MSKETYYSFCYKIKVRYADTDDQEHVFFANYLIYFDECLSAYLSGLGFGWKKMESQGLGFYYRNVKCEYLGSALHEDQVNIYVHISRMGNSSITVEFAIYSEKSGDLITTGGMTGVMIDIKTKKSTKIPHNFRLAIEKSQKSYSH